MRCKIKYNDDVIVEGTFHCIDKDTEDAVVTIDGYAASNHFPMSNVEFILEAGDDFVNKNSDYFPSEILERTTRAFESLAVLKANGISPAWIERCLGLEIGSINKWRMAQYFPPETCALLKIIEHYPEMLDVARLGFPPFDKLIARVLVDPKHLKDSEISSDKGKIIGKGEDWVDIEITDKAIINKILCPSKEKED